MKSEAAEVRPTRRWVEMAELVRRHVSPETLAAMAEDLAVRHRRRRAEAPPE